MAQKQYVAKPQKVMAQQFTEGMTPDAVGVHRCGLSPSVPTGPPHVHLPEARVVFLHDTDWIIASKWAPDVPTDVLTDEQFQDLYGAGPPAVDGT